MGIMVSVNLLLSSISKLDVLCTIERLLSASIQFIGSLADIFVLVNKLINMLKISPKVTV